MPIPTIFPDNPLATLRSCPRGYYECPKDHTGKHMGPLVGYAGDYEAPDGTRKKYVGEVYYNFAAAEEEAFILHHFGELLGSKINEAGLKVHAVLGAPMGGVLLATSVGFDLGCRILFAEKKLVAPATATDREKSVLILDRHHAQRGEHVVLIEDVCNNFSTTKQLVALVEEDGGIVVAIATFINRSPSTHYPPGTTNIPVISVLHIPTEQWEQEDPAVAEDVKVGNVVWKAKTTWDPLQEAMDRHIV